VVAAVQAEGHAAVRPAAPSAAAGKGHCGSNCISICSSIRR